MKIIQSTSKALSMLSSVLFFMILVLLLVNIATRYLFGYTIDGILELSKFILVWLTFIGATYLFLNDNHIQIDVIRNKVRHIKSISLILTLINHTVVVFMLGFIVYFGYIYSAQMIYFKNPALGVTQALLYGAAPLSAVLMLLVIIFKLISKERAR